MILSSLPPPRSPPRWDFEEVFSFLHAVPSYPTSLSTSVKGTSPEPLHDDGASTQEPPSLGDFDRIFSFTGVPGHVLRYQKQLSDTSISSDVEGYETPVSSPEPDNEFTDHPQRKSVRWSEDVKTVDGVSSTEYQRARAARRRARKARAAIANGGDSENDAASDGDLPLTPLRRLAQDAKDGIDSYVQNLGRPRVRLPVTTPSPSKRSGRVHVSTLLTPASITPSKASYVLQTVWSDSPRIDIDPQIIYPLWNLTLHEKKMSLINKIKMSDLTPPQSLLTHSPVAAINELGQTTSDSGIHVFVDSSNITIGFQNALKKARGINVNAFTKRPPISFHLLAFILERGRDVAKRVVVGSSLASVRPVYMAEAQQCGYEVSSLERVEKYREPNITGRRRTGSGYGTSGQSSGSDTGNRGIKTMAEQGVDELIHMKMLESILDADIPSTIVLASGDAAEAEYSSGFLAMVLRALKKGWKVEVIAWRDSISYAYRSHSFQATWKSQFKIIELDPFSEELLAIYA